MPDGQTLLGDSRVRSPGHTVEFVNKPFYAIPFNGKNDCLSIQWQNVFGKNSVREASPLYVSYHPKLSQAPAFVSQLAELGLAAHEDREREQKDAQEGKPYFPYSRRISYFPRAKVLSYIASNPARVLFFTKHDFAPGSDKRSEEWVFVGEPFTRGKEFQYQLPKEVAVADATFELDSAPAGMTLSKEGQLAWMPPADAADRYSVIVGISRPKQPRTLHVVRLAVDTPTNPDPEPPPITAATSARSDTSDPTIQGYGLFTNDIGSKLAYVVHPLDLGRSQIGREEPVVPNPETYVPSDAVTVINSKATGAGSKSYCRANGQGIHIRVVTTPFRLLTPVAPGSKEIKSTWIGMQEPTAVVPLPEKITDAVPAGDGRYLLLAQPTIAKVAVFDVREAKVTGYVDVDSPWFQLAGGATRFVVYDALTRKLRRFDLATRALQQTATLEETHGSIFGLAMGVGSEGPIYFVRDPRELQANRLDALDLEKLTARGLKFGPKIVNKSGFCFLSASADGRTLVWAHESLFSQRLALQGETLELIDSKRSTHFTPRVSSLDGRSTFQGPRREFQSGDIVRASDSEGQLAGDAFSNEIWYATGIRMRGRRTNSIPIQFFVGREPRPVAEVEAPGNSVDETSPLLAERRIHCTIPEKTIALIGDKPPRVSLSRFEFDAAVAATSSPPLVVSSTPPAKYPAQEALTYQLEVAGKPSGLKYRLDSGPDDMTVSPTSLVSWKGPTGSSSAGSTPERGVMITVSDAAGRETTCGFRVPSAATNDFTAGGTATLPVPPTEADLVAGAVVTLPFKPTKTISAGDARYLLFVFREYQKVAIFDLATAKIVRYLELESPRSIIVGGLTRLVVVNPTTRQMSRYRLETGELEQTANYPGDADGVVQVEMGMASEGPLLMWDNSKGSTSALRIVDLDTLTLRRFDMSSGKALADTSGKKLISVSGDGRTFGMYWETGPASNAAAVFNIDGDRIVTREESTSVNSASRVNYDGRLVVANRRADVRQIGRSTEALWWSLSSGPKASTYSSNLVFYRGDSSVLLARVELPDMEIVRGLAESPNAYRFPRSVEFTFATYAPGEKTVAVLPADPNVLIVKRFDAEAEIARAGVNYVTILGAPPEVIRPGEKLSYQLTAATNHPPLLYQLPTGIKGMTISSTGLLEWTAPKTVIGRQEYKVRVVNSQGVDQIKTFSIAAQHTGIAAKPKTPSPAGTGSGAKPAATVPASSAARPVPTATGAAPAKGDPALASAPRKWTSSDGKFSMTGALVELRGSNVAVRGTDGKTIEVPLDRLSAADQSFVKSLGPPK